MALPAEDVLAYQQGVVQPLRITTGVTQGELARTLQDAAVEAQQMMLFNMRRAGNVATSRQLQAAVKGLGSLSSSLWGKIGSQVQAGIHNAADLAVDQQLDREYLLGMPFNAIRQYQEVMFFNAFHHAESIISRHTEGFALSERIIKNAKAGTALTGRTVERLLARGASAKEIALATRALYEPSVPGGVSYAAMRLGRTEINNAHHSTTIRLTRDQPWVTGYKWNLSRSHPKPDPCDALAFGSSGRGFGPGEYSKQDAPSKPHPQCLCYLTVLQVDRDEFLNSLVGGRYDKHLGDNLGVRCH
jgi:hypothetical protein